MRYKHIAVLLVLLLAALPLGAQVWQVYDNFNSDHINPALWVSKWGVCENALDCERQTRIGWLQLRMARPVDLGVGSPQRPSCSPRSRLPAPPSAHAHRAPAAVCARAQSGRRRVGLPQAQPPRQSCRGGRRRVGAHGARSHPPRGPTTGAASKLHPRQRPSSTPRLGHCLRRNQ